MDINRKFQRRLKLSIIKQHFPAFKFEYNANRDVYEVKRKGKMFYVTVAAKHIQQIIRELYIKMDEIIMRRYNHKGF